MVVSICCDCQDTGGTSLHYCGVLSEVGDSLVDRGVLRAGLVDSSGHGGGLDGGGLGSYLGIGGLIRGVVWPELGLGTNWLGARSEVFLFSAGLGLVLLVAQLERAQLVARPK